MISKYIFGTVAMAVVLALGAITTLGQVGELRGKVIMQQADGTKVPLADAQIDVFRTDMKGEFHTKTNKKGEFVFAGLPFVGEYTVAASHPTATPNFVTRFKVGRGTEANITVTPGNGKRLTAEELKGAVPASASGESVASSSSSGESASDRAKREELIRKNKEIEEGNKKINEANAIIQRTFKAGNDALTAAMALSGKNPDQSIQKYDEAVTQYDEGLVADPEQVALLTNRAQALKGRAIEKFNQTILSQSMDDATKKSTLESAQADFRAATVASNKAVALLKAQTAPTDAAELARFNANKHAALATNAETMRLFVTKADASQTDAGLAAFRDYIAFEQDPAKKMKAQLDAAQMLLDAGAVDMAVAEFQQIVSSQPDNPEANLGAGLALFASGDKDKYQDAANYLQHFVDVAPDSHKFKSDAKAILAELKSTEKVEPAKTPPARRRRP